MKREIGAEFASPIQRLIACSGQIDQNTGESRRIEVGHLSQADNGKWLSEAREADHRAGQDALQLPVTLCVSGM